VNILHVIHSVNPTGGGPIEAIKQLSRATENHCVEVLSCDLPSDPWTAGFPLKLHALGTRRSTYGYSPLLVPWIRGQQHRYDVVIANGIWQYSSFGVWRALHGSKTPYCVFTHGMLDPWFKRQYPLKHLKKWLYWPWADYRTLRDAAAVIFTAEEERRQARKSFWLYRCNEVVTNLGISGANGDCDAQKELFHTQFPALRDQRIFLFLGRIHEKKGCDILVEAFSRFIKRDPAACRDFHLVIAGPAESIFAKRVKDRAEKLGLGLRITWAGMLQGELKWGAFRAAEAFVLPSHQENFGISVAEALACGTPVLISNRINIWREIADCKAGFVGDDDLPATLALLRQWAELSEAQRTEMSRAARCCFESRFEIKKAAQSFLATLADVVEISRSARSLKD
jgi:glycosyltransferase involved in cell wall biosynthesis